jgi:hypothetical protein
LIVMSRQPPLPCAGDSLDGKNETGGETGQCRPRKCS